MRAAVVLAIAACGGETSRPGTLEVVDPGAEPRVQLQYAVGLLERDVSFVSELDGWDDKPRTNVFADMRYHVRCEAGRCRYQMVKFEVMGEGSDFESMKKSISGTITMPANGLVTVAADGMTKTTPSTLELFKMAVVPLPSVAIGVGAKWKVTDGDAQRTYRLVKREGTTLTIDARIAASSAQAKIEQGGELTVTSTDPFGRGTLGSVQTWAEDPSIKTPEHSLGMKIKIE